MDLIGVQIRSRTSRIVARNSKQAAMKKLVELGVGVGRTCRQTTKEEGRKKERGEGEEGERRGKNREVGLPLSRPPGSCHYGGHLTLAIPSYSNLGKLLNDIVEWEIYIYFVLFWEKKLYLSPLSVLLIYTILKGKTPSFIIFPMLCHKCTNITKREKCERKKKI